MEETFNNFEAVQRRNNRRYLGQIVTERGTTILAIWVNKGIQTVTIGYTGKVRQTYVTGEDARQALKDAENFLRSLTEEEGCLRACPLFVRGPGLGVVTAAADLIDWD